MKKNSNYERIIGWGLVIAGILAMFNTMSTVMADLMLDKILPARGIEVIVATPWNLNPYLFALPPFLLGVFLLWSGVAVFKKHSQAKFLGILATTGSIIYLLAIAVVDWPVSAIVLMMAVPLVVLLVGLARLRPRIKKEKSARKSS